MPTLPIEKSTRDDHQRLSKVWTQEKVCRDGTGSINVVYDALVKILQVAEAIKTFLDDGNRVADVQAMDFSVIPNEERPDSYRCVASFENINNDIVCYTA